MIMFVISGSVAVLFTVVSTYASLRVVTGAACVMMLTAMVYVTERLVYVAQSQNRELC